MKKLIPVIAIAMAFLNNYAFSSVSAGDLSNPVVTGSACLKGSCDTELTTSADFTKCDKTWTEESLSAMSMSIALALRTEKEALAGL